MEQHADTVRRLCMLHLKNAADTEDIFQTVFLKYALRTAPFENADHERAWFIRVTRNACRDLLKSVFRSRTVSLEACGALPVKYREAVYLHYYEGYTAPEIGRILRKNVNTDYTLLTRARQMLRETLGGDGHGA